MDFEYLINYTNKLKLLYIEDNENAREATLMIFEEFFKEIITAVDGQDALEKFDNTFDLIITDINMPKLNGLEMTKKIRVLDNDIPILVLSAYNESGYFIESIRLGVDGYLLKPIEMDQLLTALNKIVAKIKITIESNNNLNLLKQYQEVTDKSIIVTKTDLEGNITYANDLFCEISGYEREELLGKNHNIVRHPNNPPEIYKDIWDTIENKKTIWQGTIRNISKNRKSSYLQSFIKPILDLDNNIIEYIALQDNITEIMNQEKQLIDLSESMENPIIILINIEQFNDIKKYYGLILSNKLELEFYKKFYELISNDFIFENFFLLDNGKFAIVKQNDENTISQEDLKHDLLILKHNIEESEFILDDIEYDISIIISVAFKSNPYENARLGIEKLKEIKQDFIISNDLVEKERKLSQHNLSTLKMIKDSIENNKIITYFQEIIDNNTKEIIKYETLVRLINKDNEILTPYYFLDIAKKGIYYSQITSIVLKQAFEKLSLTNKDITINLSSIDIEKRSTKNEIFSLLEMYKENTHRIVFELLEDEEIKDFEIIKDFITKVKSYGVKIAIDDFGTGHSNFERLLDYKPDILKIDGSLIKNIHRDKYSLNVVKTIIGFAKKQNIKTVGEFVENEEIFNILKEIGVDYSQGYFFGKPKLLQ